MENYEELRVRNLRRTNTIKEEALGIRNQDVEEDEHNQGHELVKTRSKEEPR